MSKTFNATVLVSREYSVAVEADSQEQAEEMLVDWADYGLKETPGIVAVPGDTEHLDTYDVEEVEL